MDRMQENHYEELFNRLLERGNTLHAANKKRIRIGLIFLAAFTVGMILVRYMTDSDRATFLIIWVIGMFAISIYLIGIEYIDSSIAKTLRDVTERDAEWDELIPDSETVRGRMQDRIDETRDEVQGRIDERRNEMQERINERRDEMQERISARRSELQEHIRDRHGEPPESEGES